MHERREKTMIRLHDQGGLQEFADADAVVSHFSLTDLSPATAAGLKAASDAGWPLHCAIDPCAAEIHGRRMLLAETSATELRAEIRQRMRDI